MTRPAGPAPRATHGEWDRWTAGGAGALDEPVAASGMPAALAPGG
ncbi:MAG: hypothetical protein AVDCRST_MAG41-3113 [uncultured Corynebacteriales bacterium]|uniref:Uncharacterized protein n=1 Tax=uncultured Mycobacteriales bacterium TaxID=581187 RepID=A0A6J4JBY0_9ACTN|nr:MAG: hypothetical protein AVDCRST_MAG41-3113 [uncultured Corynebacteriales bacterium]